MKKYISTIGAGFLFAAQLLCSIPVFATDYFVHANVGDNRNSGLQPDDAFANLSYAMRQLRPGDTLYLRSGLYTETLNLSTIHYNGGYSNGTSTNPITIKSYPNETPIIGSNDATFWIVDLKWWVFEDLTFQNSRALVMGWHDKSILPVDSRCIAIAENITIRRVRFQHSSWDGIRIKCGKSIKIENNIFDNLRSRIDGRDAYGIQLGYQANNIIITGNHFSDIGGNSINFHDSEGSQYVEIEIINNEFEIVRPYRYRDITGAVVEDPGFGNVGEVALGIKQGPGPILIENNTIHGFRPTLPGQDATGANGSGLVTIHQASGITIRKNHFYDNVKHVNIGAGKNIDISSNIFEEPADPGIYGNQIPSGVRLNSASNVKLFNNTFYNQRGYSGWVLLIDSGDNVELKNNVFKNGIIAINTDGVTNLTADHNAWSGIAGHTWTGEIYPVVLGVNDVTEDNLGIDLLTWSPLESSPLVDAGQSVNITSDFNGAPIIGLPDIGAVEYQPQNTGIPSALITSPADGATVSGTIQVTAVASDDVGVTKVTFAVDGVWAARDTSAPYSFDWNSSLYADGVRKIEATAFDIDGNTHRYNIHVTVDSLNDIQKPSVSITGPADGAVVSGNVPVTATAFDNQGVTKVTFAIDGVWAAKDTSAPYSFTWNTSTYANGLRKLEATAYDLAGNTSKHTVYVTTDNAAPDPEAPSVSITGPADGAVVSGNVPVTATAFDNQGVTKVTFAIDGVWAAKDTSAPYSFTWNTSTYANGLRKLEATAYDLAGNTSKHTVYVTTDNAAADSEAIPRPGPDVDSDGDGVADVIEGVGDTDQNGIPDYLDAITDSSVLQGLDGVSDRYLLMTEPGLSLRLGGIALAAGKSSAGLTLEEIAAFGDGMNASVANAEDSFSYPGGIYDFEITGLLRAAQAVKVVLPQKLPVPANAVYRKYHPILGWQDFVTDASNSIASAPGSEGMCPVPGDAAYRPGLSEGDYCIQLTLEDGGPNDADGIPNGVIQDPGGIGRLTPQSVNGSDDGGSGANSNDDALSSVIGGCTLGSNRSVDPLFLLLSMSSIVMIYRRRMHRPGGFKH